MSNLRSSKDMVVCKAFQRIAIVLAGSYGTMAWSQSVPEETSSVQAGGDGTNVVLTVEQVPQFRAQGSWPKLPSQWVMAIVASTWIDEQDHLWVLQRPNTLNDEEKPRAAPPVLEFDAEGDLHPGLGRPWRGL